MYTVYLQGNMLNILSLLAHCSKGLYSRFECPPCDAEQDVITFPVIERVLSSAHVCVIYSAVYAFSTGTVFYFYLTNLKLVNFACK